VTIRISAVLLLLLASACSKPPAADTTVSDSAGVQIVTSATPRSAAPWYRVDSVPLLDLGASGNPADEFSGTIIALMLRDGRIAVANQGSSEIRFFDPSGQRVRTVGRKGSGPGEFERIAAFEMGAADSLLIFDQATRRLSVMAPGGEVVRSGFVRLGSGTEATAMVGAMADGRIVVKATGSGESMTKSGLVRDSTELQVIGPDGSTAAVGRFPGREALLQVETRGGEVVSANVAMMPFGRATRFAVSDTLIVVAPSDRYEFDLYSAGGRLIRRVRRAGAPEAVTPADLAAQLAAVDLPNEDAKARYRAFLDLAPMPATKPAYDLVVPGANGEWWFRNYLEPYQRTRPGRWTVFDRDGVWLTTVELPVGFEPTWIGSDRMLGVWLDSDDLPHVRLLAIRR